jgi:hypothetical protein
MVANGKNGTTKKTPKREHTAQRIIKAITETQGLLTLAAQRSGIGYRTICRYVAEYPSVRQAADDARERMIDFAESKLYSKIKDGDTVSILFYLKTKGKSRGYIERQEVTGEGGQPISKETNVTYKIDAKEIARAIVEAERLGITAEHIGGNGKGEAAPELPPCPDI